ncbi:MAG: carboxypeptidase-like regulatory domain-containing protein [Tannerellaceae bacterium]|nr:carboxypeptidase-like regulatory domain-containing protein [Tannerellaceae bacterium]
MDQRIRFNYASKVVSVCLLFLITGLSALAQTGNVTGVILDAQTKEPLIGVSVVVKGTTTGMISGLDGRYSLPASAGNVLVFSYIGFESQELPVPAGGILNVN